MTILPLALALIAVPAEAGRGKSGFSSRKVTDFEVAIDTGEGIDGAVIPEVRIPLALTLTDKRGRTLKTSDGTLRTDSRKIAIEVDGGRYDKGTGTLVAAVPKGDPRKAKITVVASYWKRPDLEVIRVLPIDWRAILGPDPGEVRDLALVPSSSELVDEWLLPGASLNLEVQARDSHGRTYSTKKASTLKLPWDRLEIQTEHLEGADGKYKAIKEVDRDAAYSARASYAGGDKAISWSWRADFQRLNGPLPSEVESLRWTVETPPTSPEGKAPLGAQLPVQVVVTTTEGRVFQTRTAGKLKLVPERLVVKTERARWWPGRSTVEVDAEIPGGKPLSVALHYQDRPELGGKISLRPDYIGSIPQQWWAPGEGLALGGFSGEPGRTGQRGRDGVDGREAPGPETRAESGTRGQDGSSGESGQDGAPGPRVRVFAAVAWTLDREEKVVVYTVTAEDGRPELRVKAWDAPPVRITSVGGHGGRGGSGGDGGNGGRGGRGCLSGDGGDAGDGGDGGNGGGGGEGGTVALIAASADLYDHFELRSQGGRGGEEGSGGSSGIRGSSPGYTSPSTEYDADGNALPAPTCESGRDGVDGRAGRPGHSGHDGPPGEVRTRASADARAQIGSLPAELQRALTW